MSEFQILNDHSAYPNGLTAGAVEAAIRFFWDPTAFGLYQHSSAHAQLVANGLMADDQKTLSPRGEVFVRHLLDTPLPIQTWAVRRYDNGEPGR